MPADSKTWVTSSSDAPRFRSTLSCSGVRWFILARLRFIPVIFLGPVISTKLLSITSMTTHFLPLSRPACLTHILPTSIAGMLVLVS